MHPSQDSISSLQYPDFSSQLQLQKLRQDLAHAQTQIQEYQHLISSLYTALYNIENKICVHCGAHSQKYATSALTTSSTAGAVIVSPSSKSKFSLPSSSNSPRSSTPDSVNSDSTGRSGVSQLKNAKASDFIEPNRSISESVQSSPPSATQHAISFPETSASPKDITNQLDQCQWSVDFNSDVKPALNAKLEHVLTYGGRVWRVRFSPDGKYLAVGVSNGRTYIHDVKTGAKSCVLTDNYETKKLAIHSLCFSPDGKYIAVGASGGQLRIWEIAKKRTRNIFRAHTGEITDLDFSPNGRFLVSSSYDRTVRIWRMRDGFSKLLEDKDAFSFYSVRFNPDGRYIAAGDGGGMLRIWNVMSQLVEKWTAHEKVVSSVAFTPDGKGLVSSSGDWTWKYWDIVLLDSGCGTTKNSTVRQKSIVPAHPGDVTSISVSPDGQWIVSGSADHTIRILDLRNAALQCTLRRHKGWVWSVDFCPTGIYLASGSHDGQVALWRYEAA